MVVLQVLMLWLGLSAIEPVREANPFAGLGAGAAIGYLASLAIALFVGGLVTGRLANRVNGSDVFWHGFLTWGVFTLASFAFAPDLAETQAMLEEQLALSDGVLDELEPLWTDPAARREFADEIAEVFEDGSATIDAADRQRLITFIAENTELSQAEIESRVDGWIERFGDAQARLVELEDDLRMAGEEAADALANAAMWAFFGLIVGALITWLGARAGAPSSRAETTRA